MLRAVLSCVLSAPRFSDSIKLGVFFGRLRHQLEAMHVTVPHADPVHMVPKSAGGVSLEGHLPLKVDFHFKGSRSSSGI